MKRIVLIILLLTVSLAYAAELKKLTFEQAYLGKGEKIFNPLPQIFGWADDKHYYQMEKGKLFKIHAKTGKQKLALDPAKYAETLKPLGKYANLFTAVNRTKDLNKFLFLNKGDIFLFDRGKNQLFRLTETEEEEKNPTLSPDGSKVAYTLGANLYVYHLETQKINPLTTDGDDDKILNGYASWVYYEEVYGRLSRYKAFWWSPDSRKIVFKRFDQSQVPFFYIYNAEGIYGHLEKTRFPKVGYPNPIVKLGIAHVDNNNVQWIDFKENKDHYLAFPVWDRGSSQVYFQWMNRDQDHLKVLRYHLDTGSIETVYQEKQKTWVEFLGEVDYGILKRNDFHLLENGDFIIRSSKDGDYHIYYLLRDGTERQLTSGQWYVTNISHIDEKKQTVYFAADIEDSTGQDLYSIDFNGKKIKKLTALKGLHLEMVSPGGSYFIDRYSSIHTPTRLELWNTKAKRVRTLGDSDSPKRKQYALGKVELFRINTEDGWHLPAIWLLPQDLDKTKKYPVVLEIYGGPGAPSVINRYPRLRWHFLAQQGIIVMSVDHRGSGHFGKKGTDLMYRNFGKWEMHDYIQAVKYLQSLPFVDSERIGITGGSYGAYITALALTYGADYFQYGIARSPGFDWKLYDTIYTERYMDTPKDNPDGYENASVFKYIDKYKGMIRVTHGTMDDNAHMQATFLFIDKMQEAGKTFELMLYPGERHSYRGKKRIASYKGALNFWMKHFFGKTMF